METNKVDWWKVASFLQQKGDEIERKVQDWQKGNPDWIVECIHAPGIKGCVKERENAHIFLSFRIKSAARPDRDLADGKVDISLPEMTFISTFVSTLTEELENLRAEKVQTGFRVLHYEIRPAEYSPFRKKQQPPN